MHGSEHINDIKVLLYGHDIDLPFEVRKVEGIKNLFHTIAEFKPDIILCYGIYPEILKSREHELTKRVVAYGIDTPKEQIISTIRYGYTCLIYDGKSEEEPLASVFTGSHNSGDYIMNAYISLKEQTYQNWEWVICDDGSTDGTYEKLLELAKYDHRIRPYKIPRVGKIGAVKDTATRLCYGEYLIELDHDDILTDTCIEEVVKTFKNNPDAGMVYTDFAEIKPDGTCNRYAGCPPWDEESIYAEVEYRGKKYLQACGPDINHGFSDRPFDRYAYFLTVGPNHARCFRASTLKEIGGYNKNLKVADDFDVFHRMYIYSKVVRIPKMLYIQRLHDPEPGSMRGNTTNIWNKAIQDNLEISRNRHWQAFFEKNRQRIVEDGFSFFSIIILSYNTFNLTKQCVESAISCLNGQRSEVLVIDNGSTDGSAEWLKEKAEQHKDVNVICLSTNIGFGPACNYAAENVKTAGNAGAHWLIFVNSDCIINKDTIQKSINALYYGNKIGAVGSYTNNGAFGQCTKEEALTAPEIDVPMVPGLFLGISLSLFAEVGGFDHRLLTYEDKQLCDKIHRHGLRTVIAAGTWTEHVGHATFDMMGLNADRIQTKNKLIYEQIEQKISAVCIAKNESNSIDGWINQWRGVADEILVYDTGSTDDTIKKAEAAGATVIKDIIPRDQFTYFEARNKALKSAQGDWIIMLDVDERLDQHTLNSLRTIITYDYDIFIIPIYAKYPNGARREVIARPCIFKNTEEIHWIGKVHEKLIGSTKQAKLVNSYIDHYMEFHEGQRRQEAEIFYNDLMEQEPLYTDEQYRAEIEKQWPILDWHHQDDERIAKVHTGELISIIMPTYHRTEMMVRALDSVLAQTYENWELIIIGDNCTDLDTFTDLQAVTEQYTDPRIKIINLYQNYGAGGAVPRNHGLAMAAGRYIAYLDDDNIWTPEHLQSLYHIMTHKDVSYVFGSFRMIEMDESRSEDIICYEPKKFRLDTSTVLHKKELIYKYGPWKDRIEAGYAHDWEFFSRWHDEPWAASKKVTLHYYNTANQPIDFILNAYEGR